MNSTDAVPLKAQGNASELARQSPYFTQYGMYKHLEVQVTGDFGLKNFRGSVVDVYDSVSRRRRLAAGEVLDRNGLLFTIRDALSNREVQNVAIEDLLLESTMRPLTEAHELPLDVLRGKAAPSTLPTLRGSFPVVLPQRQKTPPPPVSFVGRHADSQRGGPLLALEGERTGQWLAHGKLEGKRLDVQVVDVVRVRTKISPAMAALEGRFGWLLLEGSKHVDSKKLTVYGAGRNGAKHDVDRTCIRPRRETDSGEPFTETSQRVVVVGRDVYMQDAYMGEYAQTLPLEKHALGDGVVAVMFVSGLKAFFPTCHLCLAKNIAISLVNSQYPISVFPAN
ncbi:hypothetical protein K438DRAFT_1969560 [Mycena galopus ATCC 62051]|nr:hypothetical protein K438DRAFT_1969560 [Mycena galopus ATCC 62051]